MNTIEGAWCIYIPRMSHGTLGTPPHTRGTPTPPLLQCQSKLEVQALGFSFAFFLF